MNSLGRSRNERQVKYRMGGGSSKKEDDNKEESAKQESAKEQTTETAADKSLKKKKSVLAVEMQIERVASVLNQLSPKAAADFKNALADTDQHSMIIESYVDDDAHSSKPPSLRSLTADRQKIEEEPKEERLTTVISTRIQGESIDVGASESTKDETEAEDVGDSAAAGDSGGAGVSASVSGGAGVSTSVSGDGDDKVILRDTVEADGVVAATTTTQAEEAPPDETKSDGAKAEGRSGDYLATEDSNAVVLSEA